MQGFSYSSFEKKSIAELLDNRGFPEPRKSMRRLTQNMKDTDTIFYILQRFDIFQNKLKSTMKGA